MRWATSSGCDATLGNASPVCFVADDRVGGWMRVGDDHVEVQTNGTFGAGEGDR